MWGGGGYKMATQAILPPPKDADSGPKVASLGLTPGYTTWRCVPKSPKDHMWQSRDYARVWCKTAISLPIPQRRIFARNLFNKIDAEASYLTYTNIKIHLPLSCELGNQIRALFRKHALYKLWGRGRTPSVGVTSFQRQHLRGELWSSKNKAGHSSTQWIVSSLLFSHRKYCCTVCIFNILTEDWGWDSRLL
jgi:hypothetical protein